MANAEDKIIKWLVDEGFEVKSIDPRFPVKTVWGIDVMTPPPMKVGFRIFRPAVKPDRFIVLLGVAISPEHLERLSKLKVEERYAFSSRLLLELVKICNICNSVIEPSPLDPRGISVTMIMLKESIENMDKQQFLERIYMILNSYIAIVSYFNSNFPEPPKPSKRGNNRSTLRII